jgi:hypothetical protein
MSLIDFFRDGPWIKFKRISDSVIDWWNDIDGVEHFDEVMIREFGNLSIILCPSPASMRTEYRARHNEALPTVAAGVTWSDGTRWEIYLPYKETAAGNRVVNMWALGHELAHTLGIANPDNVDKPEFYKV